MSWTIALLCIAFVSIAALALLLRKAQAKTTSRYQLVKPLTEAEQIFYWRLVEALPEAVVLSQVTFSRFLRPERAASAERRVALNKIAQKSVDFLVCLKDFSVVAAVELDDSTHDGERDATRDAILGSAGVVVLRFSAARQPSTAELREAFTTNRPTSS